MKARDMRRNRAEEIDWPEINRRLEQSRVAIDELDAPALERQRRILRERAAALAKSRARAASPEALAHGIEVLGFRVAGERYAIESAHVAQVYPISPITSIPGVPDFVVGIVAARGDVLSVIDLRSLLDLPMSGLLEPAAIIALQSETMEFGILAEEILGVERISLESIERELPTLTGNADNYLLGVSANRTAILDAARLLSDPRLVVEIG
ncbi:MAG TPA: chemotaxis protein CheW [Oxalobacteraceae bacterium]|nr:chemotaxis protein CheW [Oxalobacteraceae bacterium]